MSPKDYCSKICGAKCCKAHHPIVAPNQCPMLTPDNLCSIYPIRLGFTFIGTLYDGSSVPCTCSTPDKFLPQLPQKVRNQCYLLHPELLNQPTLK